MFILPLGVAYADSNEIQEVMEPPSAKNYLDDLETKRTNFSINQLHNKGFINEKLNIDIFYEQETIEINVSLPSQAKLLREEFSSEVSIEKGEGNNEWLIKSIKRSNSFTIPIIFDTPGNFQVFVEEKIVVFDVVNEKEEIEEEIEEESDEELTEVLDNNFIENGLEVDQNQENQEDKNESKKEIDSKDELIEPEKQRAVTVSTSSQYASALNDPTVSHINVRIGFSMIFFSGTIQPIDRDLTISGNGNTITNAPTHHIAGNRIKIKLENISYITSSSTNLFQQRLEGIRPEFTFTNFNYRGRQLLSGNSLTSSSVVFDSGNNNINTNNTALHNVEFIQLINRAFVNVISSTFISSEPSFLWILANNSELKIDEGSTLRSIQNEQMDIGNLIVEGTIELFSNSGVLGAAPSASRPQKVYLGRNSQSFFSAYYRILTARNSSDPVFDRNNKGLNLEISNGASFDFRNANMMSFFSRRYLIDPGSTTAKVVQINSDELHLWNRTRLQILSPSLSFEDIEFTLGGNLGQNVSYVNNDEFRRLYNSQGLASYSRMSSTSEAKYQLTVEASPAEGGNPFSGSSILLQGESTSVQANTNNEYDFIRWEVVSGVGEFEDPSLPETNFTIGSEDTTIQAIYRKKEVGEVHVYHVDQDDVEISEGEILTGELGSSYHTEAKDIKHYKLREEPDNAQGVFSENITTVIYVYNLEKVSPMDPINPDLEIEPDNRPSLPENQGLLSIDFTSTFNFGSQAISAQEATYYAKPQRLLNEDGDVNEEEERPNYIQISDRRPENDRNGWQLAVTQNGQFETQDEEPLLGARLSFTNQALATVQGGSLPELQQTNPLDLVPGVKRVLVMAQGDEGVGTWIYRFGDQATAGQSIALTVPQGTTPKAEQYKTSLTWELSAVPSNE